MDTYRLDNHQERPFAEAHGKAAIENRNQHVNQHVLKQPKVDQTLLITIKLQVTSN